MMLEENTQQIITEFNITFYRARFSFISYFYLINKIDYVDLSPCQFTVAIETITEFWLCGIKVVYF